MIRATLLANNNRAKKWEERLGCRQIELESSTPIYAWLPGFTRPAPVYKARVSSLTPEQRRRIVTSIASEFDLPIEEVEQGLDDPNQGLPILAADVDVREVV